VDLANVYWPPVLEQDKTSNAFAGDDALNGKSSSEGEYVSNMDDNDHGPVGLTKDMEKAKKAK
jgi:hypothetical protein